MRDESPQPSQLIFPVQLQPAEWDEEPQIPQGHEWGWLEAFVLIQVMWGLLLFLPGSQAYRTYIRAFPYVSSLLALGICARSIGADTASPGARWVLTSFLLMVLMLMHPGTWMMAGVAQIVFQLALAAPIFWAVRVWLTAERLERLIFLVFAAHFFSAGLGLLQVYYPDTFLPPEFSSLGMKLNPEFVHELSYLGTDDRLIVRPPGLSDMPGGAAISGVIAALLAFGFATRSNITVVNRAYYLGAVLVAITVVYLTQVRSVLLMLVICMLAVAFVSLRQGRAMQGGWRAALATGLVVGIVCLGGYARRRCRVRSVRGHGRLGRRRDLSDQPRVLPGVHDSRAHLRISVWRRAWTMGHDVGLLRRAQLAIRVAACRDSADRVVV